MHGFSTNKDSWNLFLSFLQGKATKICSFGDKFLCYTKELKLSGVKMRDGGIKSLPVALDNWLSGNSSNINLL